MLFPDALAHTKRLYRRQLKRNERKLKRYTKACPENFLPFYCLVSAEKARIDNRFEQSIPLYRKAIRLFKEMGYIHFEALANEMTMRACAYMGFEEMSKVYFAEAYALYLKWGASAKIADLEEKHSALQNETAEQKRTSLLPLLDHDTVAQTLRSISTEIRLGDLLTKLMKLSVINAGAEKGFFISKKADSFFVEAYHCLANETPVITTSRPLTEHDDLLHAVVHMVDKTMKPLVLENASQSETHHAHAYVMQNKVKSVLCLPVIRQSILVGIMYFENNAIAGAFTAKHTEILQMVASQAAISFENATLYEHLIEKEKELQDLSEKLRSLSAELVLAEEKERRRIAIELHDRIGQALTASRIKIGNLQHTAASVHVLQELNEISTLIKQSIRDTRSLTFELSPHALYELGLEAALEHLAEQTREQYGLWVEFEDDNQSKQIDESTRVLMYQATRELLFNVVKHGRAQKAKLSITREGENIRIEVADNGIGFNPNELPTNMRQPKGFGIFSIKERLRHQGGHFQILSIPGQGTRAILRSPMNYVNQKRGERHHEREHTAGR
jgi:signal transduction histidine kinase